MVAYDGMCLLRDKSRNRWIGFSFSVFLKCVSKKFGEFSLSSSGCIPVIKVIKNNLSHKSHKNLKKVIKKFRCSSPKNDKNLSKN